MTVRKQTKATVKHIATLPKMHERDGKPAAQILRERREWALARVLKELTREPDRDAATKARFDEAWAKDPTSAMEWFGLHRLAVCIEMEGKFAPLIQRMTEAPDQIDHLWPWLLTKLAELARASTRHSNPVSAAMKEARAEMAGEMLCTLLFADRSYD